MSALVLITAPTAEPVTLAEAKAHLRVDNSDSDTLITALIVAARERAETETRRALITQTWDLYRDAFPSWELIVPKPLLQTVTSITYTDSNGVTQTLATDQYLVDSNSEPGRITPAYGLVWPSTRWQTNAVKVRFVAGYADAAAVPQSIKSWMLLAIGSMFENRESELTGSISKQLEFVCGLLDPYRVVQF